MNAQKSAIQIAMEATPSLHLVRTDATALYFELAKISSEYKSKHNLIKIEDIENLAEIISTQTSFGYVETIVDIIAFSKTGGYKSIEKLEENFLNLFRFDGLIIK